MSVRPRGHGRRAVLLLFVLVLLAIPSPGGAAPATEVRAVIGVGGWISPGEVTPLRIDVHSRAPIAGMLVVEVPSGIRGGLPVRHLLPLRLPAGGRQQAHLDVVVHDPRRPIAIVVRDARGERARQEVPIGVGRVVEGVVAALTLEAAGLEFLAGTEGKRQPTYITEAELPVRWQAYDAVDLLVLRDLDPRVVLPAQERALTEWIAQGGRLLVVAPERLSLNEARWLRDLLPSSGRRTYGRGVVAVAAVDLFAPARRARGELRTQVLALLDRPSGSPVADPALAGILPSTRPLSGGTQAGLAILSLLYVVAARVLLRRFGASRGGWIVIAAFIGASTAALYTFAAGARSAATSLAQLSVAEMLGTLNHARVTTYASIIAPYGGRFVVSMPDGVTARALNDAAVTYDEGAREIRGSAAAGQVSIVARQIVALRIGARHSAPDVLAIDRGAPELQRAVLYRQRQLYRLPPDLGGTIRLDPARWEPVDRPGTLGVDVPGRAMDLLFKQLDRSPDTTWLIGRVVDDRLGLRTGRGAGSDVVRLAVTEVR
ncbi:MAG TPA: hypothetical protein VJ206_01405 [bacterium]|nr:hypothetical protein [bacterium]